MDWRCYWLVKDDATFDPGVALGSSPGLGITIVRRQHPQGRDQDALRPLLPQRSSAPAHAEGPLAHAPLQPDDMPYAGARRARHATERLHCLMHPPPGIELAFAKVGLAPRAPHAHNGQRPQPVKICDDEGGLEILHAARSA